MQFCFTNTLYRVSYKCLHSRSMCTYDKTIYLFTVDCGPPGNPQHGSTNYNGTTEGSVAFYSCDQHLVPEGRMRAVCTRNGWSPLDPGCMSCAEGTCMLTVEMRTYNNKSSLYAGSCIIPRHSELHLVYLVLTMMTRNVFFFPSLVMLS